MIDNLILREIKIRAPGIMDSYGGPDTFLSYIKQAFDVPSGMREKGISKHTKQSIQNYLSTIITYSDDLIVISPWSLYVDLREAISNGITAPESISVETPYRVYTLSGDLLYTVKNHFGVFGESRLDKHLVNKSPNGIGYFLKYKTYNGREVIKLLMVNTHTRQSIVSNKLFKTPDEITSSTISIVNNTGSTLNLYFTKSAIITDSTYDFFTGTPTTLADNNVKVYNVDTSAYIYIDSITNITKTAITYTNNDLIFNINPQLLFVGVGVDPSVLNRVFNTTLQFTNKPIQDVITLT